MKKLLYSLMLAGSLHMAVPAQGMESGAGSIVNALSFSAPSTRFVASLFATNVGYTLATAAGSYGFNRFSKWLTRDERPTHLKCSADLHQEQDQYLLLAILNAVITTDTIADMWNLDDITCVPSFFLKLLLLPAAADVMLNEAHCTCR
jgi:hypothetical protein